MFGKRKKRSDKAGLAPGTLVHIGERKAEQVRITVTEYTETEFREREIAAVEDIFPVAPAPSITWINVDGLHDTAVIEKIGEHFNLHSLMLEDVLNTEQRPKTEDFGEYLYVVLKDVTYDSAVREAKAEQVSIIIGKNFVLSLQEQESRTYEPIKDRLRHSKGKIRRMGADFLAYSLLDTIVDNYFVVLEEAGENIEDLEEQLVTHPTRQTLEAIHKLKTDMMAIRRFAWPLRETINSLERGESPIIQESTGVYLRDIYDHAVQIIDTIEALRDIVSGMLDIYLSSISNRLNEVMKVLTIIATIFIPLTFLAGVYGMNFKHMPELEWYWGYPFALSLMAGVAGLMVFYFWRKKWF
jgi:magnesium transporter